MKRLVSWLWITSPDANVGLLLIRVVTGAGMLTHGIPKLAAGPEAWAGIGSVMTGLGAPGPSVFWGFMAAFAEGAGGALLLLGAGTTIASFLIAFTMAIAVFVVHAQDPFAKKELALLYLSGALLFLFKGAGRLSIDALAARYIRGRP